MVSYLAHLVINFVCNILCVVLYSMTFYKYFHLQKTLSGSKENGQKGELSLICIGAMIFVVNVLVTVYGLFTVIVTFTGSYTDE